MKVENLAAFLLGTYELSDLQKEIASEVREAARLSQKRGSTIPITVIETVGDLFAVGPNELRRLCAAFVDGRLSSDELAYISDAMQISESFEWLSEDLFDMAFVMSDPEINGPFTIEDGKAILAKLGPPNPEFNSDAAYTGSSHLPPP